MGSKGIGGQPYPKFQALHPDHQLVSSTEQSGVGLMRNEASLLGEQREALRDSGLVGGVWGSCVPSGVQGQEPLVAGSRGFPQTSLAGSGARSPRMLKRSPLDPTQTQPAEPATLVSFSQQPIAARSHQQGPSQIPS
jgi:hypothetical protein